MKVHSYHVATLMLAALLPLAVHAVPKVAVLELHGKSLDHDQATSLTDMVRKEAINTLGQAFDVITRENLIVLLEASGEEARGLRRRV